MSLDDTFNCILSSILTFIPQHQLEEGYQRGEAERVPKEIPLSTQGEPSSFRWVWAASSKCTQESGHMVQFRSCISVKDSDGDGGQKEGKEEEKNFKSSPILAMLEIREKVWSLADF